MMWRGTSARPCLPVSIHPSSVSSTGAADVPIAAALNLAPSRRLAAGVGQGRALQVDTIKTCFESASGFSA